MAETKDKSQRPITGLLLIIISTTALSTEAVAAKIAYLGGATVNTALVLRYFIAVVIFWGGLFLYRTPYRATLKELLMIAVLGIGQSLTVLTLFNSFKYIPAAMSVLFLYFYPTVVSILAYFFLQEPFTWRKVTALFLTLLGVVVIAGLPVSQPDYRGIILALAAAVLNALFLVGSAGLLTSVPVKVYNTYMVTVVFIFFTLFSLTDGSLKLNISREAWLAIFVLGFFCTVIGLEAFFRGVEIIGASRAAIASTFEPVMTAVWGMLLLNESLTGWQAFGGLLILSGVFLQQKEHT